MSSSSFLPTFKSLQQRDKANYKIVIPSEKTSHFSILNGGSDTISSGAMYYGVPIFALEPYNANSDIFPN